jgi:hypothetical protein
MKEGKERMWIEGKGQAVTWANCHEVRLHIKKGDDWERVGGALERSMHGLLPQNWALQFSEGKVIER